MLNSLLWSYGISSLACVVCIALVWSGKADWNDEGEEDGSK